MIALRKSSDRGHLNHGWLDTRHTFSFGRYHDPRHMGFRVLRVINDDIVAPGQGFGQHPHDNMEIITYILSGRLAHKDTLGTVQTIGPGDVQRMSAGTGLEHSEFNASKTDPVHLLQVWILPGRRGVEPSYEDRHFPEADRRGRLCMIASPDGADGATTINQDARVYATLLKPGERVEHELAPGRHAWLHVARGELTLNDLPMSSGDGAAISEE
jgi:redox-sensitive bicupin YhaK (pirin superfamily)